MNSSGECLAFRSSLPIPNLDGWVESAASDRSAVLSNCTLPIQTTTLAVPNLLCLNRSS
ncbi:MAG: hypothetical protein AAFQ89_08745 [Cyanobacteria bacterium J06626_18]